MADRLFRQSGEGFLRRGDDDGRAPADLEQAAQQDLREAFGRDDHHERGRAGSCGRMRACQALHCLFGGLEIHWHRPVENFPSPVGGERHWTDTDVPVPVPDTLVAEEVGFGFHLREGHGSSFHWMAMG